LNFGSEHEFQHPEGVSTSLSLHPGGLVGGFGGRMKPTARRVRVYFPELEKSLILPRYSTNLTLLTKAVV
jgi:hypothetical protein